MMSLLIAVIYAAFISLGLPDSLLGAAWPSMQPSLGAELSYAGVISMIIAGGTVLSSLLSDRLTEKFGAGTVTAVSVLITAAALFGFSLSGSFAMLCVCAVPYGLGAGAVDAALNNYVALHFASKHMSRLHCFWGVGAAAGPYIMSFCLTNGLGWRGGYRSVAVIQIILTAVLFASLPLWKKRSPPGDGGSGKTLGLRGIFKIKGAAAACTAFFSYCALETTAGLWASSYLVQRRSVGAETAARYASLFYLGITAGRFICGFIADRAGDRRLIRAGLGIISAGIVLVWLPAGITALSLAGLVLIGLGCAPVYPSIIHSTPANFGAESSQAVIGVQMASAYLGNLLMPPLFGLIANHVSLLLFPPFLALFAAAMIIMTEKLNRTVRMRSLLTEEE